MRMEGSGNGISGIYDRMRGHQNFVSKSGRSPELENTGIHNGGSVIPRIRQLLPLVHQGLLPSSSTPDRANKKESGKELGMERGGRISLQGIEDSVHHGPNPGTLRS